jgi:cytoskeletal protein CcmA (bactofilin family)
VSSRTREQLELPVVIPSSGFFEGLLCFRGRARIDGELRGAVDATGTLWLGPEARVEGRVDVDELVIEGEFRGEIYARERVRLLAGARVNAHLEAPRVAVADGCRLEGRCETVAAADRCARIS